MEIPPRTKKSPTRPFSIGATHQSNLFNYGRKKNGVIIDSYCGSGTTLVAAKILNHDFIGVEISEEYIKFAEDRLKNYIADVEYANREISQHRVEKTFKERKEKGEFTGNMVQKIK
ncbi:MAG: DNA methyltransferase, partial [bacterium]